jgi:SAM-dependent methyltransferase
MREAGSYTVRTLENEALELARLKSQAETFRQVEAQILRSSGLAKHHNVLELGCGPGFVSKLLSELASEGALVSLDTDRELLAIHREEVEDPPQGGALAIEASAASVPVRSDWADFAYARNLLQHVPFPRSIVQEVFRVLTSGGRFCAIDSDDGLVIHHPPQPRIKRLLAHVAEAQSRRGGDRFVGRKMSVLMRDAGFANVRASIACLTSSEISFEALFNILFGFKASLLGETRELRRLYRELRPAAEEGRFLLAGGVFVVVGEK